MCAAPDLEKLMALVLSLVLMAVMLPGALAVDLNVDAGFTSSRAGAAPVRWPPPP